jgi:hypothetical protein
MVKAIARAFRWREMLENGTHTTIAEIATVEKINESYVGRVLRLTLLAPDIVEASRAVTGSTLWTKAHERDERRRRPLGSGKNGTSRETRAITAISLIDLSASAIGGIANNQIG